MLTNLDIKRFQDIYKSQFGVEISEKQAHEMGLSLVILLGNIYKPIKVIDKIKKLNGKNTINK